MCTRGSDAGAPAVTRPAGFINRLPSPSTTTVGRPVCSVMPIAIDEARPIDPVM
jgi:hypothetical protein